MSQTADGSTVLWAPAGTTDEDVCLELWGIGSARALRVHWMLAEYGLPYFSHRIQSRTGETTTAAYLKLNPRHKIPLLRHGSLLIAESAAIVQYISESHQAPPGFHAPTGPAERAKVIEWCYFVMNELDGHTLYVIRRHVGLSNIYGEAPSAVEAAKIYFCEQIEAVEPKFRTAPEYLFAAGFSIADILLTSCLDWALGIGIALPTSVMAYRKRTTGRPAYAEAQRRNDPSIAPPPEALATLYGR
jgi:glutathione S-transferase